MKIGDRVRHMWFDNLHGTITRQCHEEDGTQDGWWVLWESYPYSNLELWDHSFYLELLE